MLQSRRSLLSGFISALVINGNETDREALLQFKAKISDPLGIMRSWNNSVHFCQWLGVQCGRPHRRVTVLDLEALKLMGPISPYIGNLSFLRILNLRNNSFFHEIPQEIGRLHRLEELYLSRNSIGGEIPSNISGCSKLTYLDIGQNLLVGEIPAAVGQFSNLKLLSLGNNTLSGSFPLFLGNLSSLEIISLPRNRFTEVVSEALGQLKNLTYFAVSSNALFEQLQVLNIGINLLGSQRATDLNFLCSLTNATMLDVVDIRENGFGGKLSECISNLSTTITYFAMQGNNIVGRIPAGFGNLINLEMLSASRNQLADSIPSVIGRLQKLKEMLIKLYLSDNNLQGEIPPSLGKCENLNVLDLSNNNLSGSIPSQIAGLSSLSIGLFLSSNRFTGVLPFEVGNLRNLGQLDVSDNMLSGVIPNDLGKCVMLEVLLMSGNFFHGSIPTSLSSLRGLTNLDLSRNNLTGKIPKFLVTFGALYFLNLSYNNFEGPVPDGGVFKNKKKLPASPTEENPLRLSYQSILKATNDFSTETLVGEGSFGSIYKGVLEDGKFIAIKVLKLLSSGASRSFLTECEALRNNVRHRNLVKVLTACSGVDYNGNDFKALVYDFMANGSLEDWLHPPVGMNDGEEAAKSLYLFQRLSVAIDVGSALEYLHDHCETPIVHCDIKPSNILLDDEMVGHVGDFGLAKFITSDIQNNTSSLSSSLGFRGTIGYAPPEYGLGCTVTTYGDVYSYGIVLLEMFTGRRPTDEMFKENLNLHTFVKTALPNRVADIADPIVLQESLQGETSQKNDTLLKSLNSIFEIGVACSSTLPTERMNMVNVVAQLCSIKEKMFPIRSVRTRGAG
ncbi:hypothetical protein PTKIN_Ptkin16aG0535800 [Pterospermum kingtungense]